MKKFYNTIANLYYNIIILRNGLYSQLFINNKHINYRHIPIVINNRNRFTHLKKLIELLIENSYEKIYIIDNNSTYEPLLDYYKEISHLVNIIYSKENLGYLALQKTSLYDKIKYGYFVYTDSDVLPIEECPPNFMSFFLEILIKYPHIQKVGFSLKFDDLPYFYDKKNEVIDWESSLYGDEICEKVVLAQIDTTFALHRPLSRISTDGRFKHARTLFPYEARHMPWYNDSRNLTAEEKFYINSVEIGTHWSNKNPIFKKNITLTMKEWLIKRL